MCKYNEHIFYLELSSQRLWHSHMCVFFIRNFFGLSPQSIRSNPYFRTDSIEQLSRSFARGRTIMAASCCGVKKQKLNNGSIPAVCCNGSTVHPNNHKITNVNDVACEDMCYFCFDVLHSYLYKYDPPDTPAFTNESLWVSKQKKLLILFL